MNKLTPLIVAALSVFTVGSATARYQSSPATNFNTLTDTRAALLAQFERAQPAPAVAKVKTSAKVAAPALPRVTANSASYAAPNLSRTQSRYAYLRALKAGGIAAAGDDFGTSPQTQRVTR